MNNFKLQIMKNLKHVQASNEIVLKPWWQRLQPLPPNVKYNWVEDVATPNVPDACLFFGLPYVENVKERDEKVEEVNEGEWIEVADYYVKSEQVKIKEYDESSHEKSVTVIGQAHNY